MQSFPLWHWLLLVLVLASFGCSAEQATYPVEGKVQYRDGAPVPDGMVEFDLVTDDHEKSINARGVIQEDGTFRLTTHKQDDGAVAGEHRVAIFNPPGDNDPQAMTYRPGKRWLGQQLVASKYTTYTRSGLIVTVKPGKNVITLEVEKP